MPPPRSLTRSEIKPKRPSINSISKPRNKTTNTKQSQRLKSPFHRREVNATKKRNPGQAVMREIYKQQASTNMIIPRAPFVRLLKEVCQEVSEDKFRWTSDAVTVLQAASEDYIIGLFQDSYLCSVHCKRITLMSQDLQLARRIRGLTDPGNR